MNTRKSGLLLALSSLPGPYGIGGFGREAKKFIDLLHRSRQSYWQLLPLGPTGYGNSPYSSFSTQAGNPLYIDLEALMMDGLITKEELLEARQAQGPIDYDFITGQRLALLKKAFTRVQDPLEQEIALYQELNPWLDDFALFMCLKELHGGRSWLQWKEKYRLREELALQEIRRVHGNSYNFWVFTQYLFHIHREIFHDYAKTKGVEIIGDIPFYVAEDSVEVWSRPEIFLLGEKGFVAGTPPDFFTDEGQLWGNPIYNWERIKEEDFSWWTDRLRIQASFYRRLRLDHFNAFARYWTIPKGSSSKEGYMQEGYGFEILSRLEDLIEKGSFIAEDLGTETAAAEIIRRAFSIPGMRILQVGFSPGEDNPHLPHSYEKDLFVYTGTHDNEPIMAWYQGAPAGIKEDVKAYLNTDKPQALDFVRILMASAADSVVVPVQDLLGLGPESRMNLPGTLDNNWIWRLESLEVLKPLEKILSQYSHTYRRNF